MKYKQKPAYSINWYILNGKNKTIGNLSKNIINIIKKSIILITNKKDIKFTGKKYIKKIYYKHSGFPGGLKKSLLKNININKIIKISIKNMLKKNKTKKLLIKKIKINKIEKYKSQKFKILNM